MSNALMDALSEVCGYHEGAACEHCEETLRYHRDRGRTDSEILADIELYRSDFEAWADQVRSRAGVVA